MDRKINREMHSLGGVRGTLDRQRQERQKNWILGCIIVLAIIAMAAWPSLSRAHELSPESTPEAPEATVEPVSISIANAEAASCFADVAGGNIQLRCDDGLGSLKGIQGFIRRNAFTFAETTRLIIGPTDIKDDLNHFFDCYITLAVSDKSQVLLYLECHVDGESYYFSDIPLGMAWYE